MSYRVELAAAARWLKAAVEALPEPQRPDVVPEWQTLIEDVDDCFSDGARELLIINWRRDMAERLATGPPSRPQPERTAT